MGCFCWRWSIRFSRHPCLLSIETREFQKVSCGNWIFWVSKNLISFTKECQRVYVCVCNIFFSSCLFYMDIIKNSGDNSLTHAPMNGNLSTKMCPLCSCTMRIAFVHQIWSLMNSPICQVEHSPFHFIPYSVPHIYRSSTTALRRLYIQSTLSIMYRKNNWSVATSSSP